MRSWSSESPTSARSQRLSIAGPKLRAARRVAVGPGLVQADEVVVVGRLACRSVFCPPPRIRPRPYPAIRSRGGWMDGRDAQSRHRPNSWRSHRRPWSAVTAQAEGVVPRLAVRRAVASAASPQSSSAFPSQPNSWWLQISWIGWLGGRSSCQLACGWARAWAGFSFPGWPVTMVGDLACWGRPSRKFRSLKPVC